MRIRSSFVCPDGSMTRQANGSKSVVFDMPSFLLETMRLSAHCTVPKLMAESTCQLIGIFMSSDTKSEEMMYIGYVRVSKQEQNEALQIDTLKKAGCKKWFLDKITGSKFGLCCKKKADLSEWWEKEHKRVYHGRTAALQMASL